MAIAFMKKVMNTPKMKTLRKKRKAKEVELKRLAGDFRRTLRTESRRLSKQIKKAKKKKRK